MFTRSELAYEIFCFADRTSEDGASFDYLLKESNIGPDRLRASTTM
jgi:hypothetical protein